MTVARGPIVASSREYTGTPATTTTAVTMPMAGSDVTGQAPRNAASRTAFEATWCASIVPATAIATCVSGFDLTGGASQIFRSICGVISDALANSRSDEVGGRWRSHHRF